MSVNIIRGDVREVLPELEANSFDCICTSPPYYKNYKPPKTLGWQPSCKCRITGLIDATPYTPSRARILDPFSGSGTTGLVADRLGRDCMLIDLNTSYIDMAINRIHDDAPLFAEVAAE